MPKKRVITVRTAETRVSYSQKELKKILGLPEEAALFWEEGPGRFAENELQAVTTSRREDIEETYE